MTTTHRVWKYGDNVDTDLIFPGKETYTVSGGLELAKYALVNLDPDFPNKVQKGMSSSLGAIGAMAAVENKR